MRALVIGVVLALAPSGAAFAQQEARQAGEAIVQAYNKAGPAKDAAAVAEIYTEDATLVTADGPVVGRAAIQKYFENGFKSFTYEKATLNQAEFLANGQVMIRNGSVTGTLKQKSGTVPVKGYWATTDVREGNAWKIRQEEDVLVPQSPPQQ